MEISEEEVEKIKQIAALPDAYLRLIKSIAPSIIGLQVQKEAMLLLLVGSPMIKYPDETQVRGNINILLVGDPGIAKSQMLRFAAQVSPRGMYASGKMSTAAGLSAAVVKDKNNVMSLEAGVVVLADQGIASIDEFEHLRAEDRSALHEMMEQQSYHPSLEVLLASGRKVKIGEYVDGIFDSGQLDHPGGQRLPNRRARWARRNLLVQLSRQLRGKSEHRPGQQASASRPLREDPLLQRQITYLSLRSTPCTSTETEQYRRFAQTKWRKATLFPRREPCLTRMASCPAWRRSGIRAGRP